MVVEGIKESTSRNIIFKRRKLECKKRRCEEEEKLSVGNIALIGQREEKRRGRELDPPARRIFILVNFASMEKRLDRFRLSQQRQKILG